MEPRWAPAFDLISAHKCLKAGCQKDGARLLSGAQTQDERNNGHKLKHKLHVNIKNFFTLRVEKAAQRSRGISLSGDIQNATGHIPV